MRTAYNIVVNKIRFVAFYFPVLLVLVVLTPSTGHVFDCGCWSEWSIFQFQNGISSTYRGWTDYLPLYHYILNLNAKFYDNIEDIARYIYRLKYVTYFFELGSTVILFYILENRFKDFFKSLFFSLFYLLNFAVLYNSAIWGQADGIMTFFVFSSIVAGYYEKSILAVLLFVLGINMKLQAIFFLPLFLYVVLMNFESGQWKKIVFAVISAILLQFLIVSPMYFNGDFGRLWNVVHGSVDKYPFITMNAYNFWALLFDSTKFLESDTTIFLGFSYKSWGLFLFLFTSFLTLFNPLVCIIRKFIFGKAIRLSFDELLLIGSLIPLLFFFFNTQMHERYTHPAFIFITVFSLLNKKYLLLIIPSIAYFLNLEDVLQAFHTHNYATLVYAPGFIAILYLLTIVMLFVELIKVQLKNNFIFKADES